MNKILYKNHLLLSLISKKNKKTRKVLKFISNVFWHYFYRSCYYGTGGNVKNAFFKTDSLEGKIKKKKQYSMGKMKK